MVAAVLGLIAFYPFSKTLWVADELILRPRDVVEPGDALRDAAFGRHPFAQPSDLMTVEHAGACPSVTG